MTQLFPPAVLDELRSRSLSEVIGRRVKLARHSREYVGLCPFHHEKTPSFYVVEDKSFFHCFGCGAHGDIIGFAMRAENLNFQVAVERLLAGGVQSMPPQEEAAPQASRETNSGRWRGPWRAARPIAGTLGETYLATRGLDFADPRGRVLRFAKRRARKHPDTDELEHHPALLALLRDVRSGQPVGIINIYLLPDGRDRLRDRKGKTVCDRAIDAAVMLSDFDEPSAGLTVCEGLETGVAVHQAGLLPIWACGGSGNLRKFPVLPGIEALTIAADADESGLSAGAEVAERWRNAGRAASIVPPLAGDWAAPC